MNQQPQQQPQQQQQPQYQWRVTWHVQGEDDETDHMNRFSSAWALAQPWPEEFGEGGGWVYTRKEDALAEFNAAGPGPCTVVVAMTRDGRRRTTLTRD